MKDGMKREPAMKLEKQAKIFREKLRASEKGKIEYFQLFPCGVWSLQHFISWSTNMFGPTERNEIHTVFYNTLYIFRDDLMSSQEILEVVTRNLLLKKKVCVSILQARIHIFSDMVCQVQKAFAWRYISLRLLQCFSIFILLDVVRLFGDTFC